MHANANYQHWSANGAEAINATDVRGATPWHSHARLVVGRVDRGMRKIVLRNSEIALPAGAGFVLPPLLAHRSLAADPTDYRILCIPVDERLPGLSVAAITETAWHTLFERSFAALTTGCADGMPELLARTVRVVPPAIAACREPPAVQRLAGEIAEEPENTLSLGEMAEQSGLSPFHLQRLFVRATGLSPRQARLVERLHQARTLLLDGMPAGEAALACGFADQSHMSREFRKWTGLPPGRYLAQLSRAER